MTLKKKNWDDSGVSEVIGTILILGMTVVLFSTVLIWIYTIPTPSPDIKVDFQGQLVPIYKTGAWDGVNITLQHNGGETLYWGTTWVYLNIDRGGQRFTERLRLKGNLIKPPDNGRYYGLVDGTDSNWNAGERWSYTNHSILQNDRVEAMIIDTGKSILLWQRTLQGLAGLNPPIFIEKWADRDPSTPTLDTPKTGLQFYIFAHVVDPDKDLNKQSVYTTIAGFYGCLCTKEDPQKMKDDGTGGDQQANDDIFTFTAGWLIPTNLTWDGSVVIFNATDLQGHKTTSRMTLSVILGPSTGPPGPSKKPGSGAPPNLHYNGLQGFNLFNSTEWDNKGYEANETRTFKVRETVVVVVASALLQDAKGVHNEFFLYDPFSNVPPEPVVYGTNKLPTDSTQASNLLAFSYFDYVNGYNVFTYRFELNNASSVGTNYYYPEPPNHPPYYWCAKYPLEITLWDDVIPQPNKFHTTDTINITDNNGNMRQYPKLETFKNSGFTLPSNTFNSTDVVYVRITMKTVDASYYMGNVLVQDFIGGTQVWKAPGSGKNANPPICPVTGACTGVAVEMHAGTVSYRFALNLSLASQDPWIPGTQNYALRIAEIRDADEGYTLALQSQLTIHAPEYSLDIAIANEDTSDPRWGTHNLAYYYENINSWDRWTQLPILTGPGDTNKWIAGYAIKYLDYDQDGDLDIVGSFKQDNNNAWIYLFRRDLDSSGNTVWTRFSIENTGNDLVYAVTAGSIDRDTASEIIVGSTTGKVWYYKNDGSWTKVNVDISRNAQVNSIDVGDFNGDRYADIAVARNANGQKQVTWYPNLDGNGKFTTTQQTDWWKAEAETTVYGTRTNDYTYTWADDGNSELLQESVVNFPASYSNDTANAEAQCPSYGSIFSGTYTDTFTQDDGYEVLIETYSGGVSKKEMLCTWTIVVPQGSTHKFNVDAYRTAGADGFRFYYSTTAGQLGTLMFSVTKESDDDTYQTYDLGTTTGTVYITVTDNAGTNGEAEDKVFVDHMYIETLIPSGDRSALEHKWRLTRLPNRPGSTYTMYVKGYRNDPGTEGDNFAFYYSSAGQSGPWSGPTITVNQGTEATYSYVLPASIAGAEVWVRVVDMDRRVNYLQIASLYVNVLNVTVQTPSGVTGIDINLDDSANGMVLDAGNQNEGPADWFDDLAVGTAGGNIYKIMGSAGGLMPPSGKHASPGGSITGIKLAECYASKTGLEIVASSVASVYIYTGSGGSGILIKTLTTPSSENIKGLAAGDIDADGDDDIVATTGGTNIGRIVYWRNNMGDWVSPTVPGFMIGVPIWAVDLGDASNAAHRGR